MTTEEILQVLSDKLDKVIQRQDEQGEQLREQGEQLREQGEQLVTVVQRLDSIEKDIAEMKTDITAIKLDTENHVKPMLRELISYATSNSTRITMIERRTETLEDDKAIDEVISEIKQKGLM